MEEYSSGFPFWPSGTEHYTPACDPQLLYIASHPTTNGVGLFGGLNVPEDNEFDQQSRGNNWQRLLR